MTRYILIESNSGFVWGEAEAPDPIAACRAVDERLGETGREYREIAGRFDGRDGYVVYTAPAGFAWADGTGDGQSPDVIAQVSALPAAARVLVVAADE